MTSPVQFDMVLLNEEQLSLFVDRQSVTGPPVRKKLAFGRPNPVETTKPFARHVQDRSRILTPSVRQPIMALGSRAPMRTQTGKRHFRFFENEGAALGPVVLIRADHLRSPKSSTRASTKESEVKQMR